MSWTRSQELSGVTPGPSLVSDEGVSPQFYNNNTAMVYAPSGGTAAIECQVKNLGDRAVSYIIYLTRYLKNNLTSFALILFV